MKKSCHPDFVSVFSPFSIVVLVIMIIGTSCQKQLSTPGSRTNEVQELKKENPKLLKDFTQVNLISNTNEYGAVTVDPNLVNAWGLSFSSGGVAWISSFEPGLSLVYNSSGTQVRAPVSIPSPSAPTGGHPTGTVFNGSSDFVLSNGSPARFLFDGVDGVISGWNPGAGNFALVAKHKAGAVYTGLALAQSNGQNYLYAANFSWGKIDVYDKNFNEVNMPFNDPGIPEGYAPFNIQNIGPKLYVMYAKVGEGEEEPGPGLGYVSIFNTDGSFDHRFTSKGQLNAPWGIAQAPAHFFDEEESVSSDSPVILVGNFGDGRINAFDAWGNFLGQLRAHGMPIEIEGLWAISFAPTTATSINPNWLFFTAGPEDEEDGLFGYITK